ncbi:MAG: hypothetical protein WD002_07050 [Pseudomonadales bacterium]
MDKVISGKWSWSLVWPLLWILSGCASSTGDQETSGTSVVGTDQALICSRERVAGSHMSKKVCRTKAQIEIDRREMQSVLDQDSVLQPRLGDSL